MFFTRKDVLPYIRVATSVGRQEGRKEGWKESETSRRPTKRTHEISSRTLVCLLPMARGIDPVCHPGFSIRRANFRENVSRMLARCPIIVDSKDIIRKRDRASERERVRNEKGISEERIGEGAILGDLVH